MTLLSIISTGRNDGYCGNYLYRLETSINYLTQNLERLGMLERVEYFLTDWGSQTPLADVLNLSEPAKKIFRCLYVSSQQAREICPEVPFSIVHSCNAALRRARGDYLLATDSDALFFEPSLRALFDLLEEGNDFNGLNPQQAYFFIPRVRLPYDKVQRQPSLEEWDRFLLFSGSIEKEVFIGGGGNAQGILAHRNVWHGLRGLDETLLYYGHNDVDLLLRATQKMPWVHTAPLGIKLYHMDHSSVSQCEQRPNQHLNTPRYNQAYAVNGEEWGCAGTEFAELRAGARSQSAYSQSGSSAFSWEEVFAFAENDERVQSQARESREEVDGLYVEFADADRKKVFFPVKEKLLACLLAVESLVKPQSFLAVGVSEVAEITCLAKQNLKLETFLLHHWNSKSLGGGVFVLFLAKILNEMGFEGYLRQITGEWSQSWQTLKTTPHRPSGFDLIYFRQRPDMPLGWREVAEMLSEDGVMVWNRQECVPAGGMELDAFNGEGVFEFKFEEQAGCVLIRRCNE